MTDIFKCVSNEIRLDGKGHLNKAFYSDSFEKILLSKSKNILLYNIPNRGIGKTYSINNFLLNTQMLYSDKIYRTIGITPYPTQEYLVDAIYSDISKLYEKLQQNNSEPILIVVDDVDLSDSNFRELLGKCVWRNVKIVGFVK